MEDRVDSAQDQREPGIASLTEANKDLQEEISRLKLMNTNIKNQFEDLNKSYIKLRKKHSEPEISLSSESFIIKEDDLDCLLGWIPLPTNPNNKLVNFRLDLLYRGTRDEFTPSKFYEKCGDNFPTISFIQSKGHGKVFGGYTSQRWIPKNINVEDSSAFLFSLTHKEKYPVKDPKKAIFTGDNNILCFGEEGDICLLSQNNCYCLFPSNYECSKFSSKQDVGAQSYLAGEEGFKLEEIEVYKVVTYVL